MEYCVGEGLEEAPKEDAGEGVLGGGGARGSA